MAKYKTKPMEIEAIQWNGNNRKEILQFTDESCYFQEGMFIKTLEGDIFTHVGDYIIKVAQGRCYPCKPDVFKEVYKIVKEK